MRASDFVSQLTWLAADYASAVRRGELGAALDARDKIGKLVVSEIPLVLTVFKYYEDPLNAQEDNQPEETENEVPF